jgi:tripartite-type tricarboxylate transporter receptor subunit TctC
MKVVTITVLAVLTLATNTGAAVAAATSDQPYPDRPIRMLTNPPGGAPDFTARLLAQSLPGLLGEQVIVDNRASTISIETAAKAPADGYTVLVTGSALWLSPFMRSHTPWDPLKNFEPVTLAISAPTILVVHPSLPVKSVKDLITLAKSKPGALNYGSTTTGTIAHIAAELFKSMTGTNITRVPYKGAGPALIALVSGEVQTAFATASSGMPYIRSNRLRALAVTSLGPSPLAPGLPPVSATVPGYEVLSLIGVFAPAKTPSAIVARLNAEMTRILRQDDIKGKIFSSGSESVGSTPEQLLATVKSEMDRIGKMIKAQGIRQE